MRLAFAAAVVLALLPQEGDATERLLRVAERRLRETSDPTDPRGAAARLGFDRAKIAEFVGGLSWEPYPGILRDAAGTLMCGGGNSIDRALLLQAMLEAGGERTRLMRVDVPEADGAKFLEAFRKRERKERPDSDPKALARELGVDPDALEAMVTKSRRQEAALVDEVVEAAKVESARLAPLVGALDVDPSPVEIARKNGQPLTPAAMAAQRRAVTFRLILNRKTGGKPEPVPLLNVPLDLSQISWKVVEFLIQPAPGQLPRGMKMRQMEPKDVLAAFKSVKQYRAVLIVEGKSYGGVPFDLDGKTYAVDAGGRVGPAKALSGGLGKAFGGAFGGGGDEPSASALESVVLELAVKEPGGAEKIHRRTVAEAPKPGVRALPFLRHSYLVDSGPLPAGERGRRQLRTIVANAAAMRKLIRGPLEGIHFKPDVDLSSALLIFGDLRRRALSRIGEGTPFVQDRPAIVAETSQVFLDEEGVRVLHRQGFDIVENPGTFDGSAARTMALGVAETALECLLVERLAAEGSRRSAWILMERGRLQGGKAETADRDGRREVRWSPDAWWSVDPSSGACVGRVPSGAGQGLIETLIESAGQVCSYADAVGFLSGASGATGRQPEWADKTTSMFGRGCALMGGTSVRDEIAGQIQEMTKNLWNSTIGALSGM
jgi:hypothetical protein